MWKNWPTHGGSLRIYAKHREDESKMVSENVTRMLEKEFVTGIDSLEYYSHFQQQAMKVKMDFTAFLLQQKKEGKQVAGYGAAAKGNTLLNYCGIKNDLIDYVVDANPHKQNKWLPGSHIPVVNESYMKQSQPDYVILFPWNLKEEIMKQLAYIKDWGGQFVVPVPALEIVNN